MSTAIFNAIACRYDLINHILSFGMDLGWRDKVRRFLPQRQGLKVLDLATGTGDMAISLAQDDRVSDVTGVDLADGMLKIAQAKVSRAGLDRRIRLLAGDAMSTEFQDGSFDVVSVAFGVRNYPDLMKGLMEARRVLSKDGCLIILEFSTPENTLQKYFHALYLRSLVPLLGLILSGKLEAYRYLSRTILAFPYGERFMRIIRQVGFVEVERTPLAMGAATIYAAYMRD
jgi:demethylmenaquinone methyltransferase / 2-methoxy-6-polyprenyl-1,4-benzoquinol methylase